MKEKNGEKKKKYLSQRGHNITKGLILLCVMIVLNIFMGMCVDGFFNIIIKLADDGRNIPPYQKDKAYYLEGAKAIYWFTIIFVAVINCIFVYHMPNWLDSWVKAQGRLSLEKQIAFMNDVLEKDEASPQTIREIMAKNQEKTEDIIRKAIGSPVKKM